MEDMFEFHRPQCCMAPNIHILLLNIDILVDNVSRCGLLSFMDAYSGYN